MRKSEIYTLVANFCYNVRNITHKANNKNNNNNNNTNTKILLIITIIAIIIIAYRKSEKCLLCQHLKKKK